MEMELDRVDEEEMDTTEGAQIITGVISHEIIPSEVDEKELDWSPIILLPEFLERVFKSFGNKQLMGFRAVCKSWNEEICRLVTISPMHIQQGFGFKCISPTKYAELDSFLKASLNPEILIKEVQVSSEMNSPVVEVENLFRDYGAFVKYLKVAKDSTDLQILNTFLAQEDPFCPNLRKFYYCSSKSEIPVPSFSPIFKSPLKLKQLWFKSSQDLEAPAQVAIFNSIVQNSPQLTRLHIESYDSQAMEEFFKKLQTLPLLTSNLKDLSTETSDFAWLKGLAKCHFTNKLKNAKFHFIIDLPEDVEFEERHPSEKDLMNFLTLVAKSLKALDLYVERKDPTAPPSLHYPNDLANLPGMPKLKSLLLKSCQLSGNMEGLNFLTKVPSLRTLQIFEADIDEGIEGLSASNFVHHNLERIYFHETWCTFRNHCTFPAVHLLDKTFPNLKDATFTQREFPVDNLVQEQQVCFEEGFKAISQMKNLKTVEIILEELDQSQHLNLLDLTRAFSFFKEAPCLETIIFCTGDEDNLLHSFPKEPWLRELLSAPKLRRVVFLGFTMGNEKEYKESIASYEGRMPECQEEAKDAWSAEATQTFAAHNISLQIERVPGEVQILSVTK